MELNLMGKEPYEDFIEQDTALESMRASDFDCYSAYGEVIDNSIQAFATDVRIFIEEDLNKKTRKIKKIFFSDNGIGMNRNELQRCLKLGYSSRYNDRSGIGRFGVGMTLGGIHECRRIEVYSKEKEGDWNYTYLDLDEIQNKKLRYLPPPKNKKPDSKYSNFIDASGTVVVWSKYDKQVLKLQNILNETKFWMGRVFRKFIWGVVEGYKPVKISLNNEIIPTFDPLFVNKNLTGYENEDPAELLKPQTIKWKVPEGSSSQKVKSDITINVSLLPESYRRMRGKGGDNFARERHIPENEGISILRNNREVFYGHIPHTSKLASSEAERNVNRWIGVEISFSAELDDEFAVKNIKRGAVPVRDLKSEIVDRLYPTLKTQREKIQNRWSELDREKVKKKSYDLQKAGISEKHNETNMYLKRLDLKLKQDKSTASEKNFKIAKKMNQLANENELMEIIKILEDNGIVVDEREMIGSIFLDIEHGNGIKTLLYNTNSQFYKALKKMLETINMQNSEVAGKLRVLIDLIFVSYMLAESRIDPNKEMSGQLFMEDLKHFWSREITGIIKKWNT